MGCIAGAIKADDYRAELLAAGFEHVEIVDSGADLNAYAKTVSDLRKRRTKLYQAHIDDKVPTDVFVELKAALDAETTEAEIQPVLARMDEIQIDEVLQLGSLATSPCCGRTAASINNRDCSKFSSPREFPTTRKQVIELLQPVYFSAC